jgi:hypothetical protein
MHKHYNIGHFNYEQRKLKTIEIAKSISPWNPRAIKNYEIFKRKHDITDSICLMGFWLNKNKINYLEKQEKERIKQNYLTTTGMSTNDWMEQFRHV